MTLNIIELTDHELESLHGFVVKTLEALNITTQESLDIYVERDLKQAVSKLEDVMRKEELA